MRKISEGNMKYEYWFAALKPLGRKKKLQIRRRAESAEMLYNIEEKEWTVYGNLSEKELCVIREFRKSWNLEKEYENLQKKQIRLVPFFSKRYPEKLRNIPDMPYALYVKGNLPPENGIAAAIVGARGCSPYGRHYTIKFSEYLAACGIKIISGLASGIDGYAHRGALQAGGATYAVLGCGADVCYPRDHIGLYRDILEKGGGILSEYEPGMPPLKFNFPPRNRIISGLSDVILIMEAKERSGSLITADMALEQGKDVYALPGGLDSPTSRGCNRLIWQGAGILLSPEELCENLGILSEKITKFSGKDEFILENTENLVYNRLDFVPRSLGDLAQQTKLPVPEITALLVTLELKGLAKEIAKNHYVKVR